MFVSAYWECVEIMTKHLMPNFEECWWDQLILDLFGMNMLGVIIGVFYLKFFNFQIYDIMGNILGSDEVSNDDNIIDRSQNAIDNSK